MDTTLFIAQFAGPAMLAVGLGIFVSRNYYINVYRHLEQETLSVLMTGLLALVVGILLVSNHNRWDSLLAAIVSLIGWSSLIKGFLLIIVPRTVNRIGDIVSGNKGFFTFAGAFYLILGAYVSYAAYFL